MVLSPPTKDEIKEIAKLFNLELTDEELQSISEAFKRKLKLYEALDKLPEFKPPVKYPRTVGRFPTQEENPYGALAWVVSIKGKEEGKLKGKRICVKDNIMVAGVPLLQGSKMLEGYIPDIDATVVTRILDEGGEIVAKTTSEALSSSGGSHTSYPWPVLNPRNPEYMAGGSSSGSAAAVASGYCDIAIGGDQGGSIRIPSSWVGIYGLKPTYGLVPYTGAFSLEPTLDHLGPMANNVEDLALALEVIAGRDDLDPRQPDSLPYPPVKEYSKLIKQEIRGLKVAIVKEGFGWPNSEKDVDEIVYNSAKNFEKLGVAVDEISIPMHKYSLPIYRAVAVGGKVALFLGSGLGWGRKGYFETSVAEFFGNALKARARDLPSGLKEDLIEGYYMITRYNNVYYAKARNLAFLLRKAYDDVLKKYDALIMPTTPFKAVRFDDESIKKYDELLIMPTTPFEIDIPLLRGYNDLNTAPFNVTGHPAINVPVGYSNGLPVGMMIIGRHFEDDIVLRLAYAYEKNFGN